VHLTFEDQNKFETMKTLTISDLERQGPKSTDPIWILNTAPDSLLETQGEVFLSIPKLNAQGNDPLRVPQTWIPIEVTRAIPRRQLLASTEFRSAINSQLITPISAETAQKMLRQSGATEEIQRLDQLARHIRRAGAARTISDSQTEIRRADGVKDDDDQDRPETKKVAISSFDDSTSVAQRAAAGVENVAEGITPAFNIWLERLNEGTDVEASNAIKSRRKFSTAELRYLSANLLPSFTKTIAMVNKNIK